MRKNILLLVTILSLSLSAQNTKEFYGKLNYSLVPHNMLNGIGYSAGYHWDTNRPISYKIEMGMLTSYRERKMNETFGDIRYLDLHYNLAQMNLAIIPNWHFFKSKQLDLSIGFGLTGGYQSKIFMLSNYEYLRYKKSKDIITQVDASSKYYAGLVGAFDINYQLSEKWIMSLSTQYQLYYQGESLLSAGIGVGYKF